MRKTAMAAAVLAALLLLLAGCSFSFSSAKVEKALMTTALDENGAPVDSVQSYPADTETLYASAELRNAPDNTRIRIVWTYETAGDKIGETTVDSGDITDRYLSGTLTNDGLFPAGDYKVDFYVDDREEPDATAEFSVTAVEYAYVEDAHMTSGMGADGKPADTIDTVGVQGTWVVSAVLRNTAPGTMIHFVWFSPDGQVVFVQDFDPQGQKDVYIACSLQLNQAVPEGDYSVGIYVDDSEDPAAKVEFTAKAQ
jgi:hypothetical protein